VKNIKQKHIFTTPAKLKPHIHKINKTIQQLVKSFNSVNY